MRRARDRDNLDDNEKEENSLKKQWGRDAGTHQRMILDIMIRYCELVVLEPNGYNHI